MQRYRIEREAVVSAEVIVKDGRVIEVANCSVEALGDSIENVWISEADANGRYPAWPYPEGEVGGDFWPDGMPYAIGAGVTTELPTDAVRPRS